MGIVIAQDDTIDNYIDVYNSKLHCKAADVQYDIFRLQIGHALTLLLGIVY